MGSPSLGIETGASVSEMPIVSVEGTAAWAPCLVGVQTVVDVGILGFGEVVAELEHLGPPVGTETHPAQAVAALVRGKREFAASLPSMTNHKWGSTTGGAGVEHPCPTVDAEGMGVEHPILVVAGCSCL